MTFAISFDGVNLETDQPTGIDVATREFIRAHFRFSKQDMFYCVCPNDKAFGLFQNYGVKEDVEPERCVSINQNDALGLEEAQCLLRYDPGIVQNAWARRYHGQRLYSLCGVAHASASATAMEMVGSYLLAPLQPWDALICPSNAIRNAIHSIIEAWELYFKERFGKKIACPLELPIIPLGVDTAKFAKLVSGEKRTQQRKMLGITDNEIVLLYVGRLNYLAKSNPLPLLIAGQEAAARTGKPLRILFNGYFNDEPNKEAFDQAVNAICKNVTTTFVQHGDPDFPYGVWAASDVFCSLPDNIQESFGITPLEAMATGLPIIASDWDGYRDTVRDGIEGITVPTYMPATSMGNEIAYRYYSGQFTYGDYLGATSQSTAVDVVSLTEAILKLANNPELRATFGQAGKRRATECFEWSRIIAAYEELWGELSLRRKDADELGPASHKEWFHPSRPNPFVMFNGFPTETISLKGRISITVSSWPETLERIKLKIGLVLPNTLMELEELPALMAELKNHPDSTLERIASTVEAHDLSRFVMTIGWLLKLGICRYHPPEGKC